MPKDTRLHAGIEDEEVVIRIGIDRLKELTESFEPFDNAVSVADPGGWATAVVEQINAPNEDNEDKSLAQEMFEAAVDEAVATGGKWLEVSESDE